jgi:hypothetical protein
MAITLMPLPVMQFFNSVGDPLAGGKLYTYQPLSLLPKATYTDSSGATPNPNPLVLDGAGRAAVWIDGSYSMTLTDADGVPQWHADNVVSGDQSQFANLQSQIDTLTSDLTGYAPLTSPSLLGTPTSPTANTATSTTQIATTAFVHNVVNQGVTSVTFVGMVVFFAMPVAPSGWLACDGSAYSRTTYANLFAVIGTTYGIGDGVNTFNVPNMKNKSPLGWDQIKTFGVSETIVASGTTGPSDIILLPCIKA